MIEGQQDGLISILLNTAIDGLSSTPTDKELQIALFKFVDAALQAAPAFKHSAFSGEQEVRLHVFRPAADATDSLLFRRGTMGIVPYVEIDLRDPGTDEISAIRKVIIGPQANERESRRAVKQLLARHKITGVDVRLSKVPLRTS